MAYPKGQRGGAQQRVMQHGAPQEEKQEETGSHRLLCADLRTGRHIWERAISGDVISAPVVSDGKVYATTFDGTSYSFDAATGELVWKKENAGTSAPVVVANEVVITQKEERGGKAYEGVHKLEARARRGGRLRRHLRRPPHLPQDRLGGRRRLVRLGRQRGAQ